MRSFFGIDSSNYTSSAAVFDGSRILANEKRLLPVREGELGLRQSDAVFHHIQNLPEMIRAAMRPAEGIRAVGVSVRPRDAAGSYMPCFLAGKAMADSIAAALCVPVYEFSHQAGHIMAALYSAGCMELAEQPFIAFHLSGGTTEALMVTPGEDSFFDCRRIASSLDLKAGQAVDRVGRMLGLPFPSGPQVDALSQGGVCPEKPRPVLKGADCCLSGLENKCAAFLKAGEPSENIARYCIAYILATLDAMCRRLLEQYGALPLVFAGGVMSNTLISRALRERYGAHFAAPAFSSDNAAGIAILAHRAYERTQGVE